MIRIYQLLVTVGAMASLILLVSCSSTNGTNGALPTATTGPVTLSVDSTSYSTSDTISVTLTNRSSQTIYFFDHQTNCTVILLQRQVNGKWEDIDNCRLGRMSILQMLDAGQHLVVKLTAPNGNWPSGSYRATLSYSTSRQSSLQTTIYSAGFQVG